MAPDTTIKPFERRFLAQRQEYQNRLPLTEKVQADLLEDVDLLRAQEGWDLETQGGTEEWLNDKDCVFHALRRNRWDPVKTHTFLLAALHQRVTRELHKPIPIFPAYSNSPLFHILPLPTFRDRVNRPIAVITLNQVHRDEHGHLDDLKEWTWWAMEMVRRTLRDWWLRGNWTDDKSKKVKRGTGGEGIVVIVDATKAGYRNLEVDLLPTLLACGHNNFPGMMEAVYVVNAGWTHRSMWSVIKRLLPKTTLEKVNFLENQKMLEEIFDLDRLPKSESSPSQWLTAAYGGNHPYTFDPAHNIMLQHYSLRSSKSSSPISRSASCTSIADVYYSAANSPFQSRAPSRHASRRGSLSNGLFVDSLRMTRGNEEPRRTKSSSTLPDRGSTPASTGDDEEDVEEEVRSPFEDDFSKATGKASRKSSAHSSPKESPIQRIKSLSNFHLYLSPSRLAHIDLLNDSESEDEAEEVPISLPPRKVLSPVVIDPDATVRSIASRRARPPLRMLGGAGQDMQSDARSYSDNLGLHHAKLLQQYRKIGAPEDSKNTATTEAPPLNNVPASDGLENDAIDIGSPLPVDASVGMEEIDAVKNSVSLDPTQPRNISAFSRTSNPWFGYPAVVIPNQSSPGSQGIVVPRYSRKRKRDLAKTLLFLFMIRLQTLRDSFERYLGLNRAGSWSLLREKRDSRLAHVDPSQGLMMSSHHRGALRKRTGGWPRDWAWWIVGFLLLRGTWVRLLAVPLEILGLESLRDLLGLV